MALVNGTKETIPDQVVDDLAKLLEKTGLTLSQENGQRKLGPPADYNGARPTAKGTEIFVGKLPRDCFEPELYEVFSKVGEIYELRLMMDFTGTNRGFCFIQFYKSEEAQKAIRDLNNFEIRKGRFIGVVKSVDNCRLFVGGIPTDKSEQDILEEIKKVTDGVIRVIMYPSAADKGKNRGFSFVEYNSHKAAAMARRKMIPGKILMWGIQVAVDWAEPEPDVDSEIMSKVQVLYVRNLMLSTTEEHLLALFNTNSDNGVEKVKKLKDFAFVHFVTRDQAEKAKAALNDTDIDGSRVEITWAKPVDKNIYRAQKALSRTLYPPSGRNSRNGTSPSRQSSPGANPPQQYAGYAGNYGVQGHGLMPIPAGYQNGGLTSIPPYLHYQENDPNVRAQRMLATRFPRGRAAAGVQGIRLPPQALITQHQARNMFPYYGQAVYPDHYYYAYQYHHQQPPAVLTSNGVVQKKTTQDLLELCTRNGWGEPIYSSASYKDDAHNIYHVFTIIINRPPPFGPKEHRGEHCCSDMEEARSLATDEMFRILQNEILTAQAHAARKYQFAFAV